MVLEETGLGSHILLEYADSWQLVELVDLPGPFSAIAVSTRTTECDDQRMCDDDCPRHVSLQQFELMIGSEVKEHFVVAEAATAGGLRTVRIERRAGAWDHGERV